VQLVVLMRRLIPLPLPVSKNDIGDRLRTRPPYMPSVWQHGPCSGDELVGRSRYYPKLTRHALLMTKESNFGQVHQARTEARAEAEAAAEQRSAAALEHQRAELVKQARSRLCVCGSGDASCTATACSVQTL